MVGPVPYLCASDSPFANQTYTYFYLENCEDHLFNVPGVTASNGGITSVVFGPSIHDSVDCDDGVVDGSGLMGDSFFSQSPSITFTFNAAVLGSLPTRVGIVWTDGGANSAVTFRARDGAGTLLGTIAATHGDSSNNGTTAEDRFHGAIFAGGIGSITISNTSGGIEVDHLQYAGEATQACDAIDFNGDGLFPDTADIDDFLSVFSGGPCSTGTCGDIDFNNDGLFPDTADIDSLLSVFSGGACL